MGAMTDRQTTDSDGTETCGYCRQPQPDCDCLQPDDETTTTAGAERDPCPVCGAPWSPNDCGACGRCVRCDDEDPCSISRMTYEDVA